MSRKICIIQTASADKVIQSFIACKHLREEVQDLELSFIGQRKVCSGLIFMLQEVFDNIFLFDTKDFFVDRPASLTKAITKQTELLKEINKEEFDLAINLTNKESAQYLTSLISAQHKMGPYKNLQNETVIPDLWSQFLYAHDKSAYYHPFNEVDIYKNIIGVKSNYHYTLNLKLNNTISLYYSEKSELNDLSCIELNHQVLSQFPNYQIQLISDHKNSKRVKEIYRQTTSSVSQDKIKILQVNDELEVFNSIARSQLFIGDISKYSHFAGVADKEAIVFFNSNQSYINNAPYSNKAFGIQANIANNNIQDVVNIISVGQSLDRNSFSSFNFYVNSLDENLITTETFFKEKISAKDSLKLFNRVATYYFFKATELNVQIPGLTNDAINSFNILTTAFEYLNELYGHAMKACYELLEHLKEDKTEMEQIKLHIDKISEIDSLINETSQNYQLLVPITNFFYINKLNSSGESLVTLTENTLVSYHQAQQFIAIIADLTNTALGPKIISNSSNMDV